MYVCTIMHVCTMSVLSSALEAPVIRTNSLCVCKHTCNKALLIIVFLTIFMSSCPSVCGFLLTGSQTSFDSMSDDCLWYKKLDVIRNTSKHKHVKNTHTLVFYGLRGLSIGVMVFILYKQYVLLPYTYPIPKLSPHRRLHFYFPPQKIILYDL